GQSMLGTVCCCWNRVHMPACTHATSATTATTERMEDLPHGAGNDGLNPSPRFDQDALFATHPSHDRVVSGHGEYRATTVQNNFSSCDSLVMVWMNGRTDQRSVVGAGTAADGVGATASGVGLIQQEWMRADSVSGAFRSGFPCGTRHLNAACICPDGQPKRS